LYFSLLQFKKIFRNFINSFKEGHHEFKGLGALFHSYDIRGYKIIIVSRIKNANRKRSLYSAR
jgi:hypothetical protein